MASLIALGLVLVITVAIAVYLIAAMFVHIRREKRKENLKRTWANFALSMAFCTLFLTSWTAHGISSWQEYVQEQHQHGEAANVTGYLIRFGESTLENWQSEFLQLFSFVVLSALFIHHGSAESKDSDDRMEARLSRIEEKLGARS